MVSASAAAVALRTLQAREPQGMQPHVADPRLGYRRSQSFPVHDGNYAGKRREKGEIDQIPNRKGEKEKAQQDVPESVIHGAIAAVLERGKILFVHRFPREPRHARNRRRRLVLYCSSVCTANYIAISRLQAPKGAVSLCVPAS
jgi:hypothetical protein